MEGDVTGILDSLFGRPEHKRKVDPRALVQPEAVPPDARPPSDSVCSSCGRSDLPPAGDWDPPICQECDAALNFDAIEEPELWEEQMADDD